MHPEYSSISTLIEDICSLHDSFSRDFLGKIKVTEAEEMNLKNQQVRNVIVDEPRIIKFQFMKYLQWHHEMLSRLFTHIEYEYEFSHLDFRSRVKQKDSIVNKLLFYRYEKDEKGKVALNKCLNDLLGFRIIVDDFNHRCEGFDNICKEFKRHYKIHNNDASKEKENYFATHVYFYGKNQYFPWELQIWSARDAKQNEISHTGHKSKREYINWPQAYKVSNEYEK